MAMRTSRETFDRLKKMLITDKIGAEDGFLNIFKTEITRLIKDYFVLDEEIEVKIDVDDFGIYKVNIDFDAEDTKRFSTAIDQKGIY